MTTTPQETPPTNVIQAMARVMEDVRAVKKDGRYSAGNTNYNFRGVDGVVNALGPVLRKYGVVVVPSTSEAHYRDVTTAGGKPSREATVNVTYAVYGPGGVQDFVLVNVPGEALDSSDKGTAKAMSVAFRIALLQAFALPTEDRDPDDDRIERDKPAPENMASPNLPPNGLTELRIEFARAGKSVGLTTSDLDNRARDKYRKTVAGLSEAQLKKLIDDLPQPEPA